jgi:hypothetical protein
MATTNQSVATGATPNAQSTLSKIQDYPPIINLGKVKPKQAKKLKKGKIGTLTNELSQRSHQIQAGVEGKSVPVYISYEEKPRTKPKKKKKKKKINLLGLKIDRKKFKSSLKKNGVNPSFL